jgi:hypothetical protein
MAAGLTDAVITAHAAFEMGRRGLTEQVVREVLTHPEQRFDIRPGRDVLQARVQMGDPSRSYVIRVFVDVDRDPAEVVTAYRTSKMGKYWRVP